MVKTRESHAFLDAVPEDLGPWLSRIKDNNSRLDVDISDVLMDAVSTVREAQFKSLESQQQGTLEFDDEESNCLQTGLEMAEILSELGVAAEGLQAGILYRAVREEKLSLASVRRQYGKGVAKLIANVLDMAVVTALRDRTSTRALGHDSVYQTSKVREMLVSIIDDVRVALLKLAERTCAIRAVKNASEDKRRAVANEIFDIYAPLAHRLGIGHLKWELEDLAFRYMEPDEYQQIARLLAEKRSQRQQYIDEMIETIDGELTRLGKRGEVSGRAKNIYSIWRKMHRKDIGFSQVYDIRAVRVLVSTISDCYAVLGIVHSKWRNIPNEFDDYIAVPKDNGYRSLHTAVIGPGRKVIEIQIRTFDMHEEAEFGICAHWHYKDDGESGSKNYDDKMVWLRQVLEWHDSIGEQAIGDFILEEKTSGRVYVYTPKGHVVDLPGGATPVDFAYHIHSEIGHRCKGAKINDRIVALNYRLKTADQVEIITGKYAEPSRDWLNSTLGYIKTTRARSKIQQWFKSQNRDQNIQAGQTTIAGEYHRLGMDASVTSILVERFAYSNVEDFYEQIGSGQLGVGEVLHVAQQEVEIDPNSRGFQVQQAQQFAQTDHYIYGVGDMHIRIADCCCPHPVEPIGGYKTRNSGVTVHRKDCGNLLYLESSEPLNILQLSWGRRPESQFPVKVAIKSYDRAGLLRDITGLIDEQKLFIQALNTLAPVDGMVQIEMTTEVDGFEQLSQLLARMRQIPNVVDVWRLVD